MTVSPRAPRDLTNEYRPPEPNVLQRALPWLLAVAALVGAYFLIRALGQSLAQVRPSASILRVENGWVTVLLGVLGVVGALFVTSFLGKLIGERVSGRRISYWAVLGDQFTHVFVWIVILLAVYPLVFVLLASFDPRNSLFQFFLPTQGNALVRSGVLPSFANTSWDNYRALIDGVTIPTWQAVLLVVAGVSLLVLLVTNLLARFGGDAKRYEKPNTWGLRALLIALAAIIVFMTPAQFTGQGNESKFLLSVRNTLLVSGLTGALGLLLSTTAGYAMARLRFPGRFQTLLFFIFIQMFPVFLALVALNYFLFNLGLSNTFTGLILAYSGGAIAFNTWIYKGYVESLPESLEEASLVDGATRWQAFARVVLPLSGSILVFMFLNQFIGTYAEFIISSRVLTGVENWTVGVMLQSFTEGQFSTKWGVFAAAAVVGALPIIALFYGFQRFFVSGAVAGGVKE